MSVYKKLSAARVELLDMAPHKSGENKFSGYHYFELADFLPQTLKIFDKLGLCGIVSYTSELATLTIVDTEDNTTVLITSPFGAANLKGMHEIQNIGAVETYQRRYLWVTAMELMENDAVDQGQAKPAKPPTALDESKFDDTLIFLQECDDIDALKKSFGAAYPKASKEQQGVLKAAYDKRKNFLLGQQA